MNTIVRTIGGGKPVVMVDDSDIDADIAARMYRRTGLSNEFIHCDSGPALLTMLDDVGEVEVPVELILMDINMPGMNGIETVAAVRRQPQFAEIPIIAMLTSSPDPRDIDRAEEAGANDYLQKPMDPTDYVAMFNAFAE